LKAGTSKSFFYLYVETRFIQTPTVQSGIGSLDSVVNSSLPQAAPIASANPMQIWIDVLSLIWIAGIVVLLLYRENFILETQ